MKSTKINAFLFITVVIATTLMAFDIENDDKRVKGNGDVISTSRFVEPFSSLEIAGVYNIYLKQGDVEEVVVETDENLQDYVIVESEKGKLSIKTLKGINIQSADKKNIYITLIDIEKLEISAVGKIECTNTLVLDRLKMEFDGVGKTLMRLDCGQFNADISSVGSLELKGKAKSANIEHDGVGSLDAYDFEVEYLSIDHSGIGSVKVYANVEISIETDGIGSVRYKGPADVVKKRVSGIGSVKHVN